jgi:probable F420-dependent oxidoreductase
MRIGIHLPQWGEHASRADVIAVAQAAEECGFDSVWVADHIVLPVASSSRYPYRADATPFAPEDGFLDPLTQLAVVAGATTRIELGTSVLVLPMRHPLAVAKTVATLDVLSSGRVQLAIGAGWWKEEFDALGQRFDARGRRMDEQIRIMRAAWSEPTVSFHGEFYDFEEVSCRPAPVRPGGPPLLIGGLGPPALRRVAALGDGWQVLGANYAELRTMRVELDAIRAGLTLSTSTGMPRDTERARSRFAGLAEAGVEQAVLNTDLSPGELIPLFELYRDEVFDHPTAQDHPTTEGAET